MRQQLCQIHQRSQATSPIAASNSAIRLSTAEIPNQVADPERAISCSSPAGQLNDPPNAAENEDERKKANAKLKEGLEFLKKFYNERAVFLNYRRLSNTSRHSLGFSSQPSNFTLNHQSDRGSKQTAVSN